MRPAALSLLAAVLLVTGCGSDNSRVRVFGSSVSALAVENGTTFALSLPENSSIGFTWQLTGRPAGGAIDTAGDAYSSDNPDKTGSGGQHRFVFRARRAGTTVIRLQRFFRGKPRERRAVMVAVK